MILLINKEKKKKKKIYILCMLRASKDRAYERGVQPVHWSRARRTRRAP
jgi:hypothetical protein